MAFKKFTASEKMLKPDSRFNSKLVSKFINCLMWDGKKSVAQKIFYDAMDICKDKLKEVPPLELFETARQLLRRRGWRVGSVRVTGVRQRVEHPEQYERRREYETRSGDPRFQAAAGTGGAKRYRNIWA